MERLTTWQLVQRLGMTKEDVLVLLRLGVIPSAKMLRAGPGWQYSVNSKHVERFEAELARNREESSDERGHYYGPDLSK